MDVMGQERRGSAESQRQVGERAHGDYPIRFSAEEDWTRTASDHEFFADGGRGGKLAVQCVVLTPPHDQICAARIRLGAKEDYSRHQPDGNAWQGNCHNVAALEIDQLRDSHTDPAR